MLLIPTPCKHPMVNMFKEFLCTTYVFWEKRMKIFLTGVHRLGNIHTLKCRVSSRSCALEQGKLPRATKFQTKERKLCGSQEVFPRSWLWKIRQTLCRRWEWEAVGSRTCRGKETGSAFLWDWQGWGKKNGLLTLNLEVWT